MFWGREKFGIQNWNSFLTLRHNPSGCCGLLTFKFLKTYCIFKENLNGFPKCVWGIMRMKWKCMYVFYLGLSEFGLPWHCVCTVCVCGGGWCFFMETYWISGCSSLKWRFDLHSSFICSVSKTCISSDISSSNIYHQNTCRIPVLFLCPSQYHQHLHSWRGFSCFCLSLEPFYLSGVGARACVRACMCMCGCVCVYMLKPED